MTTRLAGDDTICAIATGVGGAVGIVRVSGPAAESILLRLTPALTAPLQSHHLRLVEVVAPDTGEAIDQVLACVMRAPHSYTGEHVVELHGHGGAANLGRLLAAVVRAGARVAEPGEFTRRAFLAGRLDLARAEAVAEVIAARSERAVRVAQAQLRGAVSDVIGAQRERLVAVLAEVEASVDYPEEQLDFAPPESLAAETQAVAAALDALAASYGRGRLLSDGVDVVLIGRANAGKSSLLNALAGTERALVDALPGTTRDFLEVEVELEGVRMTLVDTAGEREGSGELERRGLELGRQRQEQADVVVLVVDGTEGFGEAEALLLARARGAAAVAKPVVVAWNKSDLAQVASGVPEGIAVVLTSARLGTGLSELSEAIRRAGGDQGNDGEVTVTSERQRGLLVDAVRALGQATASLVSGQPPELTALPLREALDLVSQITGESIGADVLDQIFARFCIGK